MEITWDIPPQTNQLGAYEIWEVMDLFLALAVVAQVYAHVQDHPIACIIYVVFCPVLISVKTFLSSTMKGTWHHRGRTEGQKRIQKVLSVEPNLRIWGQDLGINAQRTDKLPSNPLQPMGLLCIGICCLHSWWKTPGIFPHTLSVHLIG